MSKLKRIILQDRERKYIDQLVHRRLASAFASRAMKKRLERKAAAGDERARRELGAKKLATEACCYLMATWLAKERKRMVNEIESLKGMKTASPAEPQGAPNVVQSGGADAAAAGKLAAQPHGVVGRDHKRVVVGDQPIDDSATEDSATEDEEEESSAFTGNRVIVGAVRTGSDSATDDSATEDSATEDEDEADVNTQRVVVGARANTAHDSATEDSATEDEDDGETTIVSSPAVALGSTTPEPEPEPEPEKYRPRVELRARPAGVVKVTFGNLPKAVRWPEFKAILLERKCLVICFGVFLRMMLTPVAVQAVVRLNIHGSSTMIATTTARVAV